MMRMSLYLSLALFSYLGFSSCQTASESPPETEEKIESFQLQAAPQAEQQWSVSAQHAKKTQSQWHLSHLKWELDTWSFTSESAILSNESHLNIIDLKGTQKNETSLAITEAKLEIETQFLSGKDIALEEANWSLKGTSFSSKYPLEKWTIQSVHAQFERSQD